MITLLHCADLHLSCKSEDESQYSLSVLDEIIAHAAKWQASALLFCGDIFDSFTDADRLRTEFRSRIATLPESCKVFFIAGNHEDLGRSDRALKNYDFGISPDHIVEDVAFQYCDCEGFDLIAIPHRQDYRDYAEWSIPQKSSKKRIAMAHGVVTGMVFTGIEDSEETSASAIDTDLFLRHGVDYAAMGHIHDARRHRFDTCEVVYPGSARVWRKKEFGPRYVSLIHCGDALTYKLLPLSSAGQFRSYDVFVDFDGTIDPLQYSVHELSPNDRIFFSFSGIVEDEPAARKNIQQLIGEVQKKVRVVEREEHLAVVAGIASQPLAKKFLERWMENKPEDAEKIEAWKRAREIGLMKIREIIEARK